MNHPLTPITFNPKLTDGCTLHAHLDPESLR